MLKRNHVQKPPRTRDPNTNSIINYLHILEGWMNWPYHVRTMSLDFPSVLPNASSWKINGVSEHSRRFLGSPGRLLGGLGMLLAGLLRVFILGVLAFLQNAGYTHIQHAYARCISDIQIEYAYRVCVSGMCVGYAFRICSSDNIGCADPG